MSLPPSRGIDDPARLVDTVAAQAPLKLQAKQALLETFDVEQRVQRLLADLEGRDRARAMGQSASAGGSRSRWRKASGSSTSTNRSRRIHKELGNLSDAPSEFDNLQARIDASGMSKEARKKADAELAKLKLMAPMSAEATVVRSYLDWVLSVPWKKKRRVRRDLKRAQEILDEDHFGLEDVKERVLEYLAVQSRVNKVKGPVLCLGRGARGGQNLARRVHRPGHEPEVRPNGARRGPRRGRDSRTSTDLHRLPAWQDPPEDGQGRRSQSAVPARRGGQDGHGCSRRSGVRVARSARPGAEQYLQRPLPRGGLRPLGRVLRLHVQLHEHPAGAPRPHGGDPPGGLHRG